MDATTYTAMDQKITKFIYNMLTRCCLPKVIVICDPESKGSEHNFTAACKSLRWPHFGCLITPTYLTEALDFFFETHTHTQTRVCARPPVRVI